MLHHMDQNNQSFTILSHNIEEWLNCIQGIIAKYGRQFARGHCMITETLSDCLTILNIICRQKIQKTFKQFSIVFVSIFRLAISGSCMQRSGVSIPGGTRLKVSVSNDQICRFKLEICIYDQC